MKKFIVIFLAFAALHAMVWAQESQELVQFETAEEQQRYQFLLERLRCLVCQNQSLADSAAGLADDLRYEVEQRIKEGQTNEQVIEFMVQRYGDFVLYDPPLKKTTVILWFAPYIFIGIAAVALIWFLLQRNENKVATQLNGIRKRRAEILLKRQQSEADKETES